jgi:hypothetical protein
VLGNSAFFVGNSLNTVQYDGFTTVLTASRSVIACQTYHIKLMIADGADDIFDSAVFLEENSFNSATYSVSVSTLFNDSAAYEGCTDAQLTFSRPTADPSPLTITFSASGTATQGTDYSSLPASVTIPAGQTSAAISVTAYADAINEGTETIVSTCAAVKAGYEVAWNGEEMIMMKDSETLPVEIINGTRSYQMKYA